MVNTCMDACLCKHWVQAVALQTHTHTHTNKPFDPCAELVAPPTTSGETLILKHKRSVNVKNRTNK